MVDLTRDKDGRVHARLLDLSRDDRGPCTRHGSTSAARRAQGARRGRHPRPVPAATRTPSTTNSPTPPQSSTRSTWSHWPGTRLATRSAAVSNRRSMATVAAPASRCTASGTCCASSAERLTDKQQPALRRRGSPPTNATTKSTSPGSAPNAFGPPTPTPTPPEDASSPSRSSPASRPAPSPRSPASAAPSTSGKTASWPTSTPTEPPTAGLAVNGLIELHRRIARGFRNRENYRLRMLLIGGGLTLDPPQV